MKKTAVVAALAATLGLTACSEEQQITPKAAPVVNQTPPTYKTVEEVCAKLDGDIRHADDGTWGLCYTGPEGSSYQQESHQELYLTISITDENSWVEKNPYSSTFTMGDGRFINLSMQRPSTTAKVAKQLGFTK